MAGIAVRHTLQQAWTRRGPLAWLLWPLSLLYRALATLRTDVPILETLDELRWNGADADALRDVCAELAWERFADEVARYERS